MTKHRSGPLAEYLQRRNFDRTPEPDGTHEATGGEGRAVLRASVRATPAAFVIQKHHATRLHYDLRLELDGVMLSWAVPRGPSFDPTERRLAVRVEDHPIGYNRFEGTIPKGQYGAGRVIVWDRGQWRPIGDPRAGLAAGKLVFDLAGSRLYGRWELVRTTRPGARQDSWLLFKKRDAAMRSGTAAEITRTEPDRVGDEQVFPTTLSPQLASDARGEIDEAHPWLHEIKFDGYRILARFDTAGRVALFTRNGLDWTSRAPALANALQELRIGSSWLDGEIVVLDDRGIPDFGALQRAFDRGRSSEIVYFVFDMPYQAGVDLRARPLAERRQRLELWLQAAGLATGDDAAALAVRLSERFPGPLAPLLDSARRLGLEGLIAKRNDAPYESRRTSTWLKFKDALRQEFVVTGFTNRNDDDDAREVSSLALAVFDDDGAVVPVGHVGTGWNSATAADLRRRLEPLRTRTAAVSGTERVALPNKRRVTTGQTVHAVRPELVVMVRFAGWTRDGQLRQAVYESRREDIEARAVRRVAKGASAVAGATTTTATAQNETAAKPHASSGTAAPKWRTSAPKPRTSATAAPKPRASATAAQRATQVTHPARIVDASTGITKLDLVQYYDAIAPWLLPHLKDRPAALLRAPRGIDGQTFFQKHSEALVSVGVVAAGHASKAPQGAPLVVPTVAAITGCARMNVVEFHTMNERTRRRTNEKAADHAQVLSKPDRLVFDLDPGEGLAWSRVIEAALIVRQFLEDLGLQCWLKTSGGKGLHVVVPIAPRIETQRVFEFSRAFVERMAQLGPDRFTSRSGPMNRVGRLYVDHLRNRRGASTVAAYSVRARPGMGVSMPVPWSACAQLRSGSQWHVGNARDHVSLRGADPWEGYWQCRQGLSGAVERLRRG